MLRGQLERPMVCGSHLERRGPSPQGAGSVYWLDRGATAPTTASGGQQFAFVCSARVPLSQPGQSVHEADVGALEFGLGKHVGVTRWHWPRALWTPNSIAAPLTKSVAGASWGLPAAGSAARWISMRSTITPSRCGCAN